MFNVAESEAQLSRPRVKKYTVILGSVFAVVSHTGMHREVINLRE